MSSPAITLHDRKPQTMLAGSDHLPRVYYLASPYTHDSKLMEEQRYLMAIHAAAELNLAGYVCIEPIAMGHAQATRYQMPTDAQHWKQRNRAFISRSDGLIVLMIEGWYHSSGVTDEIIYAFARGRPVFLYEPEFGSGPACFHELDRDSYLASKGFITNPLE